MNKYPAKVMWALLGRPTFPIQVRAKCDYCDERMAFAGSEPINMRVRRACVTHKKQAQQDVSMDYEKLWQPPTDNEVKDE